MLLDPSHSTEINKAPRGLWKSFTFETGDYLLYIPAAHLLKVTPEIAAHVRGEAPDQEVADYLLSLAQEIPIPEKPQHKPNIGAVSLNMAQGCNLRCTYCFAGEGDYGKKSMMTSETAINVLGHLAQGKERFHVIFFGGEPLLNYKTIVEVVEWCETQSTKFSFGMTTNSTLLNEAKLNWLKEKNFQIIISYDGKGLHAKQRLNKDLKSNSESLVEKKLSRFKEELGQLRSMVLRTTVTKKNLPLLEEAIVETLTSQNYRFAVSHHSTPEEVLRFTDEDIEELGHIMGRVVDRLLAKEDYETIMKIDNIKKYVMTIHKGKVRQPACGAGLEYLTVSTSGNFYLCHRFNEEEEENFGNFRDGLDHKKMEQIANFRDAKTEPCSSCWMREWCAGGCFHDHKARSGNKFEIDYLYCKLQGIEIEEAMRVYTHIMTKAPHLLK